MNKEGCSPLHGIIVIWSGTINDIPDGWVICDGTNGTPNLRDKFVRSRGGSYEAHSQGGTRYHNHTINIATDSHSHAGQASSANINLNSGTTVGAHPDHLNWSDQGSGHEHQLNIDADVHNHTGLISTGDHNPNYYTLCYIMKL